MCSSDDLTPLRQTGIQMQWDVKIPLRDGTRLSATLYLPKKLREPSPVIVTLTPYVGQTYHDRGVYFAKNGLPFLSVDVRGRGNSEGEFRPLTQEARDGYDVVEWVARQSFCNGKVAMWGGSYSGYSQWATAKERPPHLASIVPVAAPYVGIDFPMRNNIPKPYLMQWLTLTSGRASQERIFADQSFWSSQFQHCFESGAAFEALDTSVGNRSDIFQEWIAHPTLDSYWDRYNPSAKEYAQLALPILTITGIYDGDQPGALMHYREHLQNAAANERARHFLVIGPWDHAGTRTPKLEFVGLKTAPASLLDLPKLHLQWYRWTMEGGPKPEFLQKNVAYYVMGAEKWRYADSLEAITSRSEPLFLQSTGQATDVFAAGSLTSAPPLQSEPDCYVYDPRDVSSAELESTVDPESRSDHRLVYASVGKQLTYISSIFRDDVEVSGFFRLRAWLAIDQPDTDFRAWVYEVSAEGSTTLMTTDSIRARYRESLREETLIRTCEPLRYDFERFTFVSREIRKGSRLRLVIGPVNSIYSQKNYNSGGVVAHESMKDARTVTVRLFHDEAHPSALYLPCGQTES